MVNHLIWQAALPTLPFGSVGDSGMGAYHGRAGLDTFSHYKSAVSSRSGRTSHMPTRLRACGRRRSCAGFARAAGWRPVGSQDPGDRVEPRALEALVVQGTIAGES